MKSIIYHVSMGSHRSCAAKHMKSKNWLDIRKELYRQVRNHVRAHLGQESAGLMAYQKAYEKEFLRPWRIADRDGLIKAAGAADFLFFGDFHALQQSQKAQLRVLKTLPAGQKMVLGLECFQAAHQKSIDRYMDGKLSEKDFLKAIQWDKTWGFPWEHYKPILRWAQKRKAKIIGLNLLTKDQSARSLSKRDKFAAGLLWQAKQTHPDHQVIVIYGDLHLAEHHLPLNLKKRWPKDFDKRSVFVFQNSEKIYFDLLARELELQVDVVKLTKNKFCLMSVPPWVKWQNYLLYLEHYDSGFDEDADFTDYVAKYVKVISEDLSVKVQEGSFSVYSAQDDNFWDLLSDEFEGSELDWYESLIEEGESFYVPELSAGYLARSSVNHAASLAMSVVYAQMKSFRAYPHRMPEDFLRLIWLKAVEYMGSKFINPKRKTDTFSDIKIALSARQPSDRGKEALQLSISQKMQELLYLSRGSHQKESFRPKKKASYREAASLLGGMLGEKMFSAYRKRLLSKASLVALLSKPLDSKQFRDIYFELIEIIENFPEPFQSKSEKM